MRTSAARSRARRAGARLAALLAIVSAAEAAPRAADVIYVPAAAHVQGEDFFQTDLVITNVHDREARVTLMFLPTGNGSQDNRGAAPRVVRERLPPGGTEIVRDVLASVFDLESAAGALLVFGCESSATCQDVGPDGVPIGAAPLLVRSRTYAVDGDATFGQAIPGVAFYDVADADPTLTSPASQLLLAGLVESPAGATGVRFRANVGLLNGSESWTTVATLSVLDADGALETEREVSLGPLAHVQLNRWLGSLGLADGKAHTIRVHAKSNTLVAGASADVPPALLAYASSIDEASADPVYVEGAFPASFETRRAGVRAIHPVRHR